MLALGPVVDRNAMPTVDEVIGARVRADIAEKMFEMLQAQLGMPANGGPGGVESAK
jgi:hypothetical protein